MRSLDEEVDRNFDAFQAILPDLIGGHRGEYALLRHGQIEALFTSLRGALDAGVQRFSDRLFSIQEVTDRPADLGLFSHADGSRLA